MGLLILAELPRCTISFRAAGEELVCSKLKAAGDGPSGRQAVPWAAIPSHRVEWVMSGLTAFRGPEVPGHAGVTRGPLRIAECSPGQLSHQTPGSRPLRTVDFQV